MSDVIKTPTRPTEYPDWPIERQTIYELQLANSKLETIKSRLGLIVFFFIVLPIVLFILASCGVGLY